MVDGGSFALISPEKTKQNETYLTVPGIVSSIQYVGEINDPNKDERLAWTIITPRQDCLDVEELFVKPECRRKGFGTKLLTSLSELSRSQRLPLRFLIPFSDCEPANFAIVRRILARIGYRVEISGVRWAPYFGILSPGPDVKPYFPQKPGLASPQP